MTPRLRHVAAALFLFTAACSSDADTATTDTATTAAPATTEAPDTTVAAEPADTSAEDIPGKPVFDVPENAPGDLEINDLIAGTGRTAQAGDYLTMHYVGVRQVDGGQFDASWDRGTTFGFTLGAGGVIQGWDMGIEGMQEGGRRLLSIPADLAYGDQARGADIPANSDLVFVVDLINVATPPDVQNADAPVTELEVEVLSEGTGVEITEGMGVELHYVLMAQNSGEVFDSSWATGQTLRIQIGADPSQAIPGWDEALIGKNIGDHVRVVIPPELGLGERGDEVVGEGGTLVTEVTLIGAL
jgi:peptidylprolyl isomerase